jgi:hypothetical protein
MRQTLVTVLLIGAFAAVAHGADFVLAIDPALDPSGAESELHAALSAANANGEPDTILLFPDGAYAMTASGPSLTTEVEILGNDATLSGAGSAPLGTFEVGCQVGVSDLTLDGFSNALYVTGGLVRLRRLHVLNSSTNGLYIYFGPGSGAGMSAGTGVEVCQSTFDAPASMSASAIYVYYQTGFERPYFLEVDGCLIKGHQVGVAGADGGVGRVELRNTTITGTGGFPVLYAGRELLVIGCTIAGNQTAAIPGTEASAIQLAAVQRLMLGSSIVADNNTGSELEIAGTASNFFSFGHNIIGAGVTTSVPQATDQSGTPGSPIDPVLDPLADNGGPTLTRLPGAGSPALDGGGLVTLLATDQRGFPRDPVAPDVGAVDIVDTTAPTVTITPQTARPTNRDVIVYDVVFSQDVGSSFGSDDLTLMGTLSGAATAVVSGAGADWTVRLIPDDPNAAGSLGFEITGEVWGPVPANPLVVPVAATPLMLDNPLGDRNDDGAVSAAELNEVVLEYRGLNP